jgi:hypothetical protein
MQEQRTCGRSWTERFPANLFALFVPGLLFVVGLFLLRDHERFSWVRDLAEYPWEFWVIALCGSIATVAGSADWAYHRSGKAAIGRKEHHSELMALACGGVPLFVLMAAASVIDRPMVLLIPVIVVLLFTVVMICFDEFVFHRRRCGWYETILHRLLVFGHGIAWLAWANWCFVRGA